MKKRIISLLLMIVMVVSIIPIGTFSASAAGYKERTTAPDRNNPYYYSKINNFYLIGLGLPNCTCYAWGRAYEVLGTRPKLSIEGAGNWYSYNKNGHYYDYGTTPRAGAIACWSGHVAFVESVNSNGTINVSQSHYYKKVVFEYYRNMNPYTYTKNFQGYIYVVNGNYTPTPTPTPAPSKPSLGSISASNVAKGRTVTFSWHGADRATGYKVAIRGAEYKDIDVGNATSYSYVLGNSGTYSFYAMAYNSTGNSGWTSNCLSCTAHDKVTATFVDSDGTVLNRQNVDYGSSATPPPSPTKKGYIFQGWDSSYYNLTANRTIKATYQIEKYTVNFLDINGDLISAQKVEYGKNAVEPTDKKVPTGYEFVSWNSEAYKNVYTDASNKTINVQAIYKWGNEDLPIICSISKVECQDDGFYVFLDLKNYNVKATKGRAVVSLKTASGKLVDMTESAAFSIKRGGSKNNFEVFIPSEKAGSKIEVIIVKEYSSGTPISEVKTIDISDKERWTYWDTYTDDELAQLKANPDYTIEQRTEYRYRDKEFSTETTKNKDGADGWTFLKNGTPIYSNWSGWTDAPLKSSQNAEGGVEVNKRIVSVQSSEVEKYRYYHWWNGGGDWLNYNPGNYVYHSIDLTRQLSPRWQGPTALWYGTEKCHSCNAGGMWIPGEVIYKHYDKTQYQSRSYTNTYVFYRFRPWSEWQTNSVVASGNRECDTRITYRYKSISGAKENDNGKLRSFSGKVDTIYSGKQITLFIYKVDATSDYTNEFIGQTVIASDGSYSFNNFKLREEPTIKTGDFTVAIGIEGTSNLTEVGKIEAPIPNYSVKFYNWDGTILSEETVAEGKTATLPQNPEREGYDFIGWDNSVANIKEDVEINPVFEKKQFTVMFIDWNNRMLECKKFYYNDVLTTPDYSEVKGYKFNGWDKIIDGTFVVTEDMVVTAEYSKRSYNVKFIGYDNNVISDQTVKFGEDATAPDNAGKADDGRIFAGWQDNGYMDVNGDAYIYPIYYYETTADVPTATYEKDGTETDCVSGEYNTPITLTLSTGDKNDVIYYSINGSENNEEIEYTGPITIDKTCSITYYATGFGKNDSEAVTRYYCINTGDTMSDWMSLEELPEAVRNAIGQENSSYIIEKATGYKFKDVTETSDVTTAKELVDNGWTLIDSKYTEFTDWQDEKIDVDTSKIGFEVETNNGAKDGQEFRYLYSHYKYVDSNGETKYAQNEVDGFKCEYEEIYLDERINIDPNTYSYIYDGQSWYSRKKVVTEYCSRYQISSYYKWTDWGITPPVSSDKRETETADVYRYANNNYHIVTVYTMDSYPEIMFVKDGKTVDTTNISNLQGYNYRGLYTDENYGTAFGASTAVTKSMELYVKYTPKTYKVTFQMPNGVVVDEQEVEYMCAATDPGADSIDGYVFGGWDEDYSCITEDTVITGKYYKESEYPRIALNRSSVVLYTGTYFDLIATVTPSDIMGKDIAWSSSDPTVATVDENGKVTAVKAGQAVITAKVIENRETASCTIIVQSDLASKLMLKENSKLNRDDIGYIRRVSFKTPVSDIKNEFINENIKFIKYDDVGKEIVFGDTDFIGTGTIVRLMDVNAISDEAKFVITGDVDGDGMCTLKDSTHIMQYLLEVEDFAPYQIGAADINGDGFVNNKDAALIARYVAGLEAING